MKFIKTLVFDLVNRCKHISGHPPEVKIAPVVLGRRPGLKVTGVSSVAKRWISQLIRIARA